MITVFSVECADVPRHVPLLYVQVPSQSTFVEGAAEREVVPEGEQTGSSILVKVDVEVDVEVRGSEALCVEGAGAPLMYLNGHVTPYRMPPRP
jgi:hypothetical protein